MACRSVGELILPCREETSRCLSHIYGRQTEDFGDYHSSAARARRRQSDFLKRQTVVLVDLIHSLSLHVFLDRVTGSNEVLTSPGAAASNVTKLAHQIASFLNLSMIAISNIHVDI